MATNYPASLDNFTNPEASDDTVVVPHHGQHTDANDAIEAIELELGVNPSGGKTDVTTRFDELAAVEVSFDDAGVGSGYPYATLAADDITNTPAGNISAVTVQAALNELDTEKASTANEHAALTIGVDGEHSLAGQVLSGVNASSSQKGHQKQAYIQLTWGFNGTLTPTTGTQPYTIPVDCTYAFATVGVLTAPTGATPIRIDIHQHATNPTLASTIWSTQGNRPTITDSNFAPTSVTAPDTTTYPAGSFFLCDLDTVGSTIAGEGCTVTLWLTPT